MSSNSSIHLDELKLLVWMSLGWVYWLVGGHAPQSEPLVRAPRCALCGGDLRVVTVSFDPMPLPREPPPALFQRRAD
ncbi:hypothetical protein CKO51_12845 [Rhodopirellula sp. SM50]|nr:hypothetical protein CKO51_12845 [Rhodopirellula sp. SM50]